MSKSKKLLTLALAMLMVLAVFAGCAQTPATTTPPPADDATPAPADDATPAPADDDVPPPRMILRIPRTSPRMSPLLPSI